MSDETTLPVQFDENGVNRLPPMADQEGDFVPLSPLEQVGLSYADQETFNMNVAKGLIRGVERLPLVGSQAVMLAGEGIKIDAQPKPKFPWMSPDKQRGFYPPAMEAKMNEAKYRFGESISEIGRTATEFYNKAAATGMEAPNPAIMMGWNYPFQKVFSMAAESGPMLGLAALTTAATGPITGAEVAAVLGASTMAPVAAGDFYEDAIAHGMKPEQAMSLAMTTGAFQTATEGLVLSNWMRGGNIMKRIFRTMFQEGFVEEGSQQVFDNELRIIGWDEPRPIIDRFTDGVAESMAAGAVMGAGLGGFAPPTIEDIHHDVRNYVQEEGHRLGMKEEQIVAAQKVVDKHFEQLKNPFSEEEVKQMEGGMTPEKILSSADIRLNSLLNKSQGIAEVKGPDGKVLTPAVEPQALTAEEIEELKFLQNYGKDVEQVSLRYGVNIAKPAEAVKTEPEVKPREVIVTNETITREMVKSNPQVVYLFGDNLLRTGRGGQAAAMRGEPNAIGIPTKKKPSMTDDSFFTDDELEQNKQAIDRAFSMIPSGAKVVIPKLGEGRAQLKKRAPQTYAYLQQKIQELKEGKAPGAAPVKLVLETAPIGNEGAPQETEEEGVNVDLDELFGVTKKFIPMREEPFSFEKVMAWSIRQGRDIPGSFKKFIGPDLKISKRFTQWAGAYASLLGSNGTIMVQSYTNLRTIFHETGHFLDDYFGKINVWRDKVTRDELMEVSLRMRWAPPEVMEARVPVLNKKTGKTELRQTAHQRYRRSRAELMADFISAYVIDPEICRVNAPNFTKKFEETVAKEPEFQYVVAKLREFSAKFQPLIDMVLRARKIPEIKATVDDWVEKGNGLQMWYRKTFGDKIWKEFSSRLDKIGEGKVAKHFFERGGLPDFVFQILRQRRKDIAGQILRLKETIVEPLSRLSPEEQTKIAEDLQNFDTALKNDPENPLAKLTEEARKELILWGNEARVAGLLDDDVFFNNVGQYFPFFYSTVDFNEKKNRVALYSTKIIKANFDAFKKKHTDFDLGMAVLKKIHGSGKKGAKIIDAIRNNGGPDAGIADIEAIGRQAREDMGLIKTAAYPIYKRVSQLIETVYTVKAFNTLAAMEGFVGTASDPGYKKMPEAKKYGDLSGKYVPGALVDEVSKWTRTKNEFQRILGQANSVWKLMKVPYSPSATFRNMVTNMMMAYIADVPIYNPAVSLGGIMEFINKGEIYQICRDNGLYKNTYADNEMQELAFMIKQKEEKDTWTVIQEWANKIGHVAQSPARMYGAIEDASKTIFAAYALKQGATPLQAVKYADKYLFDYGQTSWAVDAARQGFYPFITWSAKALPIMVETAIRKPEKIAMIVLMAFLISAFSRSELGIDRDEEERLKPEYIRGKLVLLMPMRDNNGDLNWIDLTFFLPWGSWMPVDDGHLAVPQVFIMSNPFLSAYNAFMINYDPFYGQIAPDYLPQEEQDALKWQYMIKNLAPNLLMMSPQKIIKSTQKDAYGREGNVGQALMGELMGVRITRDTSAVRGIILTSVKQKRSRAITALKKQKRLGEIDQETFNRKLQRTKQYYKEKLKSY